MTTQPDVDQIAVLAPSKINLSLHAGTKRSDGFHELESLVAFAAHADRLRLEPGDSISLLVKGPFARGLMAGDDNLVVRAARALAKHAKCEHGARIILDKRIPLASGVGGGSADAAAVLRGLVRLWDLKVEHVELMALAASLGSDVPMCVASVPAWVEGRGERILPLDAFPLLSLVLVNPMVEVSTGEVFRRLGHRTGVGLEERPFAFVDARSLLTYLHGVSNDLELPAIEVAPVIGVVLGALRQAPGVRLARMSGSGATCFAIVDDAAAARACASALRAGHPDWWVVETSLGTAGSAAPAAD